MSQYFAKSHLLPVLAVVFLFSALLLMPADAYGEENKSLHTMTAEEIQDYKPVIKDIQIIENMSQVENLDKESWQFDRYNHTQYIVTLKNPLENSANAIEYYGSTSKDGTYEPLQCVISSWGVFSPFPQWPEKQYDTCYIKVRYCRYMNGTKYWTKYSEPFAVSGDVPMPPAIAMYRQTGKIFVEFQKTDGFSRSLQIREKGTDKWVSVTKSPLVKEVKTAKSGYTLTLDTSKSYEVRGRQAVTCKGKKIYSQYAVKKSYSNPSKVTDISFLRYDKTDGIAILWPGGLDYQIAYRKAGSSDSWQKITVDDPKSAYIDPSRQVNWWTVKSGYEYKIRPYVTVAGKKFYGYYSKVYTCNKKSYTFVNEINPQYENHLIESKLGYGDIERPSYDHSLSIDENFHVIRKFASTVFLRMWESGEAGVNYGAFQDPYVDFHSRASEGLVGLRFNVTLVFNEASMALELLRFYAEDDEVANALFCWIRSVQNFGHANSDYFGFRDVKEISNGFIIEMNGQEIIVEKTENGTMYWFDVTK